MHSIGISLRRRSSMPAFGADKDAMARIERGLPAGLHVIDRFAHGLTVQGNNAAVERLFGIELHNAVFAQENGVSVTRIAAVRPPVLPAEMRADGAVVAAFDPVIRMRRHSQMIAGGGAVRPDNRNSVVGPYWFTDLKQAYHFPSYQALNGSGTAIGILISGGFQQSDMTAYFNHEALNSPSFATINVFGGAPFSTANSGETHLDLHSPAAWRRPPVSGSTTYPTSRTNRFSQG